MESGQVWAAAMTGSRGGDQKRIAEVGMDFVETILSKNHDYGSSVWKEPVLAPGCSVSAAIQVRMSDKVSRIRALLKTGDAEVGESLEDTIKDLGAYCLLWLAQPGGPELG